MPGTGEIFAVTQGGATEVPIHDLAGSTLGLAGSSGTLQTQWSYEPFGAPTASGAASPFQFLFRGQQYDPTGYYGEYSPRLQRSLRGDVLPYTGQGSNEFGRFPGYIPFKFHRTPTPWGRIATDIGLIAADDLSGGGSSGANNGDFSGNIGFNVNMFKSLPVIDIFFAAFGGGASAPELSARYYKQSHSPACTFFGAALGLCADNSEPHYLTGLINVVYNQSPTPSPTQTPGNIPCLTRPCYDYKYCGWGSYPGLPNGANDKCCQQHDNCYGKSGLSGNDVSPLHAPPVGSSQWDCDEDLCGCTMSTQVSGPWDYLVRGGIIAQFCHSNATP